MSERRRAVRPIFTLPDRTLTRVAADYVKAWRTLGTTVAEVLGPGWTCYAFDPDLSLSHPTQAPMEVDRRLANAIQAALQNKEH